MKISSEIFLWTKKSPVDFGGNLIHFISYMVRVRVTAFLVEVCTL